MQPARRAADRLDSESSPSGRLPVRAPTTGIEREGTLLKGACSRPERLPGDYDHPGGPAALREVARETGATPGQVVLARQIGHEPPILPPAGISSLARSEENLAAVDPELSQEQRARLDAAR